MLLIGTDAPSITPAHLRDCAEALHDGNDAVLLPAEDGGYVAIGLSRPATRVFDDIRWSTEHVFEDTRHQLDRAGLRWHQGPTLWDIDVPADLARWHALNHLHNLNNLENA